MRYSEILSDSAINDLKTKLPSLAKHDYDTIDKLMKKISKKHKISANALHDIFVKKYNKTPDDWIKSKLDEKELTTEDIKKTLLYRKSTESSTSNTKEISEVYRNLYGNFYGRPVINPITESVNNLLPHIYEQVDSEIKQFYTQLKRFSKSSHSPIKIGAKVSVLQAVLDIYSHTVILRGFKNPKTIVDITLEDGSVKQIIFDDGTKFPEKYEYSTTELGLDLLDTFFFNSRHDLEKMLTSITLILPDSYQLGTKLLTETIDTKIDIEQEVNQFVDWACNKLNISNKPKIELSQDTEEAQENHHTGGHAPGSGEIWVYAKNRNLVDILRTVFHELVHVRQHELGMIGNGDSYPGSPIEVMADAVAGKYIKIYGKKYPKIFQ